MAERLRACRSALLLGVFLTASYGYGEEPGNNPTAVKPYLEERASLAASIPRREAELAERQRREVLAEVKMRAREMDVRASAEEMTDLLLQRAHLQIGLDKCRLADGGAASCRAEEKKLTRVEKIFRETAGLSAREFQGGRRDTPVPADKRGGPKLLTKSQSCTCALSVHSSDRWMNRWWGLEVGGHASHGVCSNNVDYSWPHTPGSGAMTGDIDIYFGSYHQHKECKDDHETCFHGPSTEHPGEWGNVFSCDTWHSQYYNPQGSFYGGDLSDSGWVRQVATPFFTVAGSCDGAYVTVSEYIQENDPGCCPDPMGTLWASVPVFNGYGFSSAQASAQNCNGGSQSGVPPYCGTFGATLWVEYNCSTNSPPPPPPPPECDPELQPTCFGLNETWNPETCQCETCQPPPGCGYWDEQSCLCYNN